MATGSIVVRPGLNNFLKRMYGATPSVVNKAIIGVGLTTPVVSDLDIEDPVSLTTAVMMDSCDAITGWANSTDASPEVLNTVDEKEGTGCLDLGKSGVASIDAYYTKTISSTDLSAGTPSLGIWIYIVDSTALAQLETLANEGCVLYLSDDGFTDYYGYKVGGSNAFHTGYNFIDVESTWLAAPDISSGTISLAAVTGIRIHFKVISTATTVSSGNWKMDYWHSGKYRLTQTGSIVYDETNSTSTQRFDLGVNEANGVNLTELINFNTEQVKQLEGHDVHTAISKSSKDAVIYKILNQMV